MQSELDRRIETTRLGLTPGYASKSDEWFAWYPVRTGALGTGGVAWLRRVWRNRCMGVTIYQILD